MTWNRKGRQRYKYVGNCVRVLVHRSLAINIFHDSQIQCTDTKISPLMFFPCAIIVQKLVMALEYLHFCNIIIIKKIVQHDLNYTWCTSENLKRKVARSISQKSYVQKKIADNIIRVSE